MTSYPHHFLGSPKALRHERSKMLQKPVTRLEVSSIQRDWQGRFVSDGVASIALLLRKDALLHAPTQARTPQALG